MMEHLQRGVVDIDSLGINVKEQTGVIIAISGDGWAWNSLECKKKWYKSYTKLINIKRKKPSKHFMNSSIVFGATGSKHLLTPIYLIRASRVMIDRWLLSLVDAT